MKDASLLVFIPESDSAPLEYWDLRDQSRVYLPETRPPEQKSSPIPVAGVIPETQILRLTLQPPPLRRGQLLKAIPFLLEESLASPVEEYHFSVGEQQANGTLTVVVVKMSMMTGCISRLQEEGLLPVRLMGELDLLPWEEQSWTILASPDLCWIRTGLHTGWAVDTINLPSTIDLNTNHDSPSFIKVADCGSMLDWSNWSDQEVNIEPVQQSPSQYLAGQYTKFTGIDLLQGDFKKFSFPTGYSGWKIFISWLMICWVVAMGVEQWQMVRLEEYLLAVKNEQEKIFYQFFPKSSKMINPLKQMEALLSQGEARSVGTPLLSLLDKIGQSLQQTEHIQLHMISYGKTKLEIDIRSKEANSIEQFKNKLIQNGVTVQASSSIQQDDTILVRMEITP